MNELVVKLSIQDAELIMKALIKLPYEQVVSLIQSFDGQIREQLKEEK